MRGRGLRVGWPVGQLHEEEQYEEGEEQGRN